MGVGGVSVPSDVIRTASTPLGGAGIGMCGGDLGGDGGVLPAKHLVLGRMLQVDEAGLGAFPFGVLEAATGGALGEAEFVPGRFALGAVEEPGVSGIVNPLS